MQIIIVPLNAVARENNHSRDKLLGRTVVREIVCTNYLYGRRGYDQNEVQRETISACAARGFSRAASFRMPMNHFVPGSWSW